VLPLEGSRRREDVRAPSPPCPGEYTPLTARDILVKDIDDLRLTVREMKEAAEAEAQDFLAAGAAGVGVCMFGRWEGKGQGGG
jgi:hypothetical protein